MKTKAGTRLLGLLPLLLLGLLIVLPFVGSEPVSPLGAIRRELEPSESFVLFRLRLPRVLLAAVAGSALAAGGMAFQALFRNPLATPFTLGISSGAAVGAALAIKFGAGPGPLGIATLTISAFAGALSVITLVYSFARLRSGLTTTHLLLAGVAISFACGSFLMLIQYLADFTQSFQMIRWLMGSLQTTGYAEVLGLLPPVAVGIALLFLLRVDLDLLAVGEEFARGRGVPTAHVKNLLFFGMSLMVGAVVAACGPIGFVGLMVPHMARLWIGPNHRTLLPATVFGGAVFLCLADTLARTVVYPTEIPVGIITAFLGGIFFLWLLLKSRGD